MLEKETGWLVTRRILPMLFVALIMLQLDRTNIGIAALQMNKDLGLGAELFGFGAGIFFIGYGIFEIPSNLILQRVGAPIWIMRITVSWGLATCAMALVRGPTSFYVVRFLLGTAEAGFLPGVVYYLSSWYTDKQRGGGLGVLFMASAAAGMIGGPIAAALLKLDGTFLRGWQWIFVAEGAVTVVVGLFVPYFLTDKPANAAWLPAANRAWLEQALAVENADKARHEARTDFLRALRSGAVWIFSLAYFLLSIGFYSLFFWVPQVIKAGFPGVSNMQVGWLTSIPYLCAVIGLLIIGRFSDRGRARHIYLGALGIVSGVGLILGTQASPFVGYLSLCLAVASAWTYLAVFWPAPMGLLGGTAAAGGLALINSLGNLGGFFGPYVVGLTRQLSGDFSLGIIIFAVCLILSGVLPLISARIFGAAGPAANTEGSVVARGVTP